MSLFASLLLNAVVAAAPTTPLPWYDFYDYPQKAFDHEWKGTAEFELLVEPDGRPASCAVTLSTGYEVLDKQTCWLALRRARFSPARGPDGAKTYGIYRSQVAWHRPDQESLQREPGPDLELTVESLPAGTKEPPAVRLAYFVDVQGNPSSCTALPDSAQQPRALIDTACAQIFAKLPHTPVASKRGAVPAVRTAAVLFAVRK